MGYIIYSLHNGEAHHSQKSERASLEIHFSNKIGLVSIQDPVNVHCLIREKYSLAGRASMLRDWSLVVLKNAGSGVYCVHNTLPACSRTLAKVSEVHNCITSSADTTAPALRAVLLVLSLPECTLEPFHSDCWWNHGNIGFPWFIGVNQGNTFFKAIYHLSKLLPHYLEPLQITSP